tara:strand:- start:347 stop:5401 length:5055 start_codon:yes stop_codon:yes gene_type:complete
MANVQNLPTLAQKLTQGVANVPIYNEQGVRVIDPDMDIPDFATLIEENIAQQRGAPGTQTKTSEQLSKEFDSIMKGEQGSQTLGDYIVPPDPTTAAAYFAALNPEKKAKLRSNYINENVVEVTTDFFKPVVPFSGSKYKKINLPESVTSKLSSEQLDFVTETIANRQDLAKVIVDNEYKINPYAQNILLNSFATGDFLRELGRSFEDLPGDFARMPTLAALAVNAVRAGVMSRKDEDDPDGLGIPYKERFSKNFGTLMSGWTEASKGYEDFLNRTKLFESASTDINQWYKKTFINQFDNEEMGLEAWESFHQVPQYKIYRPGEEGYREDVAASLGIEEGLPYTDVEYTESGEMVMRDLPLPDMLISDLLDLSYKSLSGAERTAIFGATQVPLTLGLTSMAVRKGSKVALKIDAYRERYGPVGKDGVPLTDMEIYRSMRDSETGVVSNFKRVWNGTWKVATLGVAGISKGNITTGRQVNTHLRNLERFDEDMTTLSALVTNPAENLDKISGRGQIYRNLVSTVRNPNSSAQQRKSALNEMSGLLNADLGVMQKQFKSYTNRAGGRRGIFNDVGELQGMTVGSMFDNPYSRSLIADDIIISAAIGYIPEMIDGKVMGFEEGTLEMVSMLTAPLVAPALYRGAAKLPGKLPLGFGKVINDVTQTVRSLPMIRLIISGDIQNMDVTQIRNVMKDEGMEVSPDAIKSMQTLSSVYGSLRPEYKQRVGRALIAYNENMDRIEDTVRNMKYENGAAVYSEADASEIINSMHMTFGEVTGLAPLLAFVSNRGLAIKPSDLGKPGKFDELMAANLSAENSVKAIGQLSSILNKKLEVGGLDTESNEMLTSTAQMFADLHKKELDKSALRQQELKKLLTKYTGSVSEIDTDTVDRIANLKVLLEPEEIRGTLDRAKLVQETAMEIMEGAREESRLLANKSADLDESEFVKYANSVADKLFDAEIGTKFALGKIPYRKVDRYVLPGETAPATLDMKLLVERMGANVSDLKKDPFEFILNGGIQFESGFANRLDMAFESAARRGIKKAGYSEDKIAEMMEVLGTNSYKEIAMDVLSKQGKNLFEATVSEAEMMYRVFRDHEAVTKSKSVSAVDRTMKNTINAIYKQADPSGGLFKAVTEARDNWTRVIGEQMDPNTMGGDGMIALRKGRKNVKTATPVEGVNRYDKVVKSKGYSMSSPVAPFRTIAELVRKYIDTPSTNKVELQDLKDQIERERDRIVYFAGGGKMIGNRHGFELTDNAEGKRRQRAADTVSSLLTAIVKKRIVSQADTDIAALQGVAKGLSGEEITTAEAVQRLSKGKDYDFGRAVRLGDVEDMLKVPTTHGKIGEVEPVDTRLFDSDDISDRFVSIDELLKKDINARRDYNSIREELNNSSSNINIAAQREIDEFKETAAYIPDYGRLAKDPERFFDVVFQNSEIATVKEMVDDIAGRMVASGEVRSLPDAVSKVKRSLSYMYHKGMMSKTGVRRKADTSGDEYVTLDQPNLFEEIIQDKNQRPIIEFLFEGEEHLEDLEMLAMFQRGKSGDALGFRTDPDIRAMGLDSLFSRVFNVARGMVSIPFVATEVTTRLLLLKKQSLMQMALRDPKAARVLSKIVQTPDEVNRSDMKLLNLRMKIYLARAMVESKGEIPVLDALLKDLEVSEDATKTQTQLVEEQVTKEQKERKEEYDEQLESLQEEN